MTMTWNTAICTTGARSHSVSRYISTVTWPRHSVKKPGRSSIWKRVNAIWPRTLSASRRRKLTRTFYCSTRELAAMAALAKVAEARAAAKMCHNRRWRTIVKQRSKTRSKIYSNRALTWCKSSRAYLTLRLVISRSRQLSSRRHSSVLLICLDITRITTTVIFSTIAIITVNSRPMCALRCRISTNCGGAIKQNRDDVMYD